MARGRKAALELHRAFDEARFGTHVLNLRESLPTADEAERRADTWLRQKQVEGVSEALVITGRGNNSDAGFSPVRERIIRLVTSLRRRNVIDRYEEHTPGSFSISFAPVQRMVDAPRRRREPAPRPQLPSGMDLDDATLEMLHNLAERSLEALGVKDTAAFLEAEMQRQLAAISAAVGTAPGREQRLRSALQVALDRIP